MRSVVRGSAARRTCECACGVVRRALGPGVRCGFGGAAHHDEADVHLFHARVDGDEAAGEGGGEEGGVDELAARADCYRWECALAAERSQPAEHTRTTRGRHNELSEREALRSERLEEDLRRLVAHDRRCVPQRHEKRGKRRATRRSCLRWRRSGGRHKAVHWWPRMEKAVAIAGRRRRHALQSDWRRREAVDRRDDQRECDWSEH